MHNLSIDALSVIARQCLAVTCLQRFCRRFDIHHPALSAFAVHVWNVAQVGPGDFAAWERGFACLAVTGMGDPWPDEVRAALPGHLFSALQELVQHDAALRGGWGPVLTDGQVRAWQALL